MRYLLPILLSLVLLFPSASYDWGIMFFGGGSPAIDWDIINEPCNDFSTVATWVDEDGANGVSEVDPAGQFRLDGNAHAAGNQATRYVAAGSLSTPDQFTFKILTYCDEIGATDDDSVLILFYTDDEDFYVRLRSDGIFINDTDDGEQEVGVNLVKESGSAEIQEWWFLVTFTGVTGDGTCDVYLIDSTHTKELVGDDVTCSRESAGNDGRLYVSQRGIATDNMVTHILSIQIATGLHIP